MTYDPQNIFAKILRGEVPCVKVYEDTHTFAFMDIMPQAEGHTLVIPKEPAADIFDLSPDMAGYLIETTQKISRAVKKAMNAPGLMIAQLNGAEAGQTVFHVHFHVIPRRSGLELRLHARAMANMDALKAAAAKIFAAL
jgi:histidine triad (HIT) family protein